MVNDAGVVHACRVAKQVDCKHPILSNEEAAEEVVGTKTLMAPEPPTSEAREG